MSGARERPTGAAWLAVIASALVLLALVGLPLAVVWMEAFGRGADRYVDAITHPHTLSALRLTAVVVVSTLALHFVFGVAFAWATTRFRLRSRGALVLLTDLPMTVSPVVAGLSLVLLFGARGWLGPWLAERDVAIIFAVPGIVIATLFVTLPFLPRELATTMEAGGDSEDLAAASLGASTWTILRRVTLPRARWALLYGAVLAGARAAGEFGAVSVVSGHVRGETNTLPLHVEILYNEYDFVAAFGVASLLASVGLASLLAKRWLEGRARPGRSVGW